MDDVNIQKMSTEFENLDADAQRIIVSFVERLNNFVRFERLNNFVEQLNNLSLVNKNFRNLALDEKIIKAIEQDRRSWEYTKDFFKFPLMNHSRKSKVA